MSRRSALPDLEWDLCQIQTRNVRRPARRICASLRNNSSPSSAIRNARIERLRRLRHMETPVDIPPAYRSSAREVRTPLAREQLKRVIGSLTANRPLVHVPPAEPTEAARAGADLRARWTNAALRRMDSEAARDVFGMLIDAMVADGAGVLKLLYAPDRWAGYPRRSAHSRRIRRDLSSASRALQEIRPLPARLAGRGRHHLLSAGRRGRAGSLP